MLIPLAAGLHLLAKDPPMPTRGYGRRRRPQGQRRASLRDRPGALAKGSSAWLLRTSPTANQRPAATLLGFVSMKAGHLSSRSSDL